MLRDSDIIFNKVRGLHIKLWGFIEFGNYFSMVKSVDRVHGTVDRQRGRVHGEPAGSMDNGHGGASPVRGALGATSNR
jgi:hypothetical protein